MARGATKAVGNLWYEARKKAAIYNGRLAAGGSLSDIHVNSSDSKAEERYRGLP